MADGDITGLLQSWTGGDRESVEKLLPLVYDDLRRRARHAMRGERDAHTLQPTALVNETYLRLADSLPAAIRDRGHFFGLASRVMRQVLVDHARRRRAAKRGGPDAVVVQLDEARDVIDRDGVDVLDLDEALGQLATLDARQARIVELRFFGGLSLEEVAGVLEVSTATVNKETRKARAWLHRELSPPAGAV